MNILIYTHAICGQQRVMYVSEDKCEAHINIEAIKDVLINHMDGLKTVVS